jgi:serine phosphatase RsbU (regulator of sigma subunit)
VAGTLAALEIPPRLGEGDVDALAALAAAAEGALEGAPLDETLRVLAEAAARLIRADLALVRVGQPGGNVLVTRAVAGRSSVLASELEGSRLRADALGDEPCELAAAEDGTMPASMRRAAVLSGADRVLVVPVAAGEALRGTLELYRGGEAFSSRERALARVAAAQAAAALELDGGGLHDARAGERAALALELAGDALAAGSNEAELAEYVVRIAGEATGADRCLLWRLEAESTPVFLAGRGLEPHAPGAGAAEAVQRALAERGAAGAGEDGPYDGRTVVPLGEPPAGALELHWDDPAASAADVVGSFAAHAGVALRRTRRAHLVELALRRSQTIVAVVSQAIAQLSLSHTLETAVHRISELTTSAHVAIYLRERDRLVEAASRGMKGAHTELAERLLELALGPFRGRGFLFIADLRRDARVAGLDDVLAETGVRRALVVPLVVRDEVIGALAVYKQRPRPYRPREEGLLIALSRQLAVAVQNARLHERTKELGEVLEATLASERRAARQLRGLFEITHSFARSLSLEATLEAVARATVEVLGVDAAAIRMPDERGVQLVPRATHVADPTLREAACAMLGRPQPRSAPLAERVLASREPVLLSADGPAGTSDSALEPFLRKGSTAAVLPLATPAEAIGTLTLLSLDPARPIDDETLETAATVTAQASLAIENARLLQQQKDFAETMQRTLLPSEQPAVPGLEVGHVYQSSARVDVGGDVYDFLSLEDGRLAVCLGDVSGKGIQAAADMAMAKFAFRALARNHPEPARLLAHVNDVVVEEIALGKFVTMLSVLIDPAAREVRGASAGHPPIRVVDAEGRVSPLLSSPGLALGVEAGERYTEERAELAPGSSLVLYTDGVIEARRDGDLYGEARLDAFLAGNAGLGAQELADALVADCRSFSGGDLADDCAVVVLRVAA